MGRATTAWRRHRDSESQAPLIHALDEAGLTSALRWYVEGFSERSKIEVNLHIPSDFQRLPNEMTMFAISFGRSGLSSRRSLELSSELQGDFVARSGGLGSRNRESGGDACSVAI